MALAGVGMMVRFRAGVFLCVCVCLCVSIISLKMHFFLLQFYMSPELAMVGLSIVPPVALSAVFYGRYVKNITRKVQVRLCARSCMCVLVYVGVCD